MTDEKKDNFVSPEVVADDTPSADKTRIVLAAKAMPDKLYLIPNEGKPIFPGIMFPVIMPPGPRADTLRKVAETVSERVVGFVLTKSEEEATDGKTVQHELYRIGTAARIVRMQETPDGAVQALLQGLSRFQILKAISREGMLLAQVLHLEEMPAVDEEAKAFALAIINTMRDLIKHNPIFSEEIKMLLSRTDWSDPARLADFAVTMTSSGRTELQEVLEELDVRLRLQKALLLLRKELDINQLKEKITHQIEEKINKQQREFFLREQMKAIKQELGLEKDEKTDEIEKYQERVRGLELPEEAANRIKEELEKFKLLPEHSPEFAVTRNYLDWLTGLPWGKHSADRLVVPAARQILNRDHYGLEDVKARILEFIGVAKLKGGVEGSILCLIGPPGVGKTSLGRGVAEALGRKFFRFSLGGMEDEAEIKGHRRTYIGAMPGKVMQAIKNVGTANPVIMLDEIDKIGRSFRGDPASALLEVLDPEQNSSFRDHYLDVPFDLSKVLFIATANMPDTIPPALIDRMEVIRLSGYIRREKVFIAKRHLVPKLLKKHGLTKDDAQLTDAGLEALISGFAREAGVRALEKAIGGCLRKIAAAKAEDKMPGRVTINPEKVAELLGKPVFTDDPLMKRGRPGVVMGLAWTPIGGSVLYIEAITVPGKPLIKLTGQLGEVMSESSHIAYSMVTARAKAFGIGKDFFASQSVHLHVPAGATPKDGPSAGITMATALISLARRQKAPARVAMTGELTLTGRVLPVGGIKEKVIAARLAGVRQVILPAGNRKDFDEIPEAVRKGIAAHFVEDYREVFALVFEHGLEEAAGAEE